jgi:hypothetical protein
MALWQAMVPTASEREERQEDLIHLLGHPSAKTASFAVSELLAIEKAGQLDQAAFATAIEGPIVILSATAAKRSLTILDRAAAVIPDPALIAVTAGLLHAKSAVRSTAIAVLRRHASLGRLPAAGAVAAAAEGLDPVERGRLASLTR